jgi:hypothetical protein
MVYNINSQCVPSSARLPEVRLTRPSGKAMEQDCTLCDVSTNWSELATDGHVRYALPLHTVLEERRLTDRTEEIQARTRRRSVGARKGNGGEANRDHVGDRAHY